MSSFNSSCLFYLIIAQNTIIIEVNLFKTTLYSENIHLFNKSRLFYSHCFIYFNRLKLAIKKDLQDLQEIKKVFVDKRFNN